MIDERCRTTRAGPLVVSNTPWCDFSGKRTSNALVLDDVKWSGRASVFALVKWCYYSICHGVRHGLTNKAQRVGMCKLQIGTKACESCSLQRRGRPRRFIFAKIERSNGAKFDSPGRASP